LHAVADPQTYWAAETDPLKFVSRCLDRRKTYISRLEAAKVLPRARRSFRTYYGFSADGQGDTNRLLRAGEQGEMVQLTPNQYAELLQQTYVRIVAERPEAKAIARNTDYRSRADTETADGILQDYDRKVSLEERENEVLHNSLLLTEGWLVQGWNPALGKEIGANPFDPKSGVKDGDVEVLALSLLDVWYDAECFNVDELTWVGFRRRYPRHRLAAQYPKFAEKIRQSAPKDAEQVLDFRFSKSAGGTSDEDNVWMFELRHLPCPELPNGRLVRFLSADVVLYDSLQYVGKEGQAADVGYPYKELHAYCARPESVTGGVVGHTNFFDLIGLHDMTELIGTILASNVNAGGLLNLWSPGGIASIKELASGLNAIDSATKPEKIDGLELRPELMQLAEMVFGWMRQRVAINDVAAEGSAQKGMPAQLAALLEAQTQQFHAGLAKAYQQLIMRSRTGLLRLLKAYAGSKRVAQILGKSGDWKLKEWGAQDLESYERTVVEPVSPQLSSFAGRMTTADTLISRNVLSARQYLAFLKTGKLEELSEFEDANLARIRRDVELLRQGVDIPQFDPADRRLRAGSTGHRPAHPAHHRHALDRHPGGAGGARVARSAAQPGRAQGGAELRDAAHGPLAADAARARVAARRSSARHADGTWSRWPASAWRGWSAASGSVVRAAEGRAAHPAAEAPSQPA
jgi:hypothetical protein